jgi:hypothetical protein
MDRVSAGSLCGVDHRLDAQITSRRFIRSDVNRLISFAYVPCRSIAVGVHRDRPQPHLATRPDNPNGDLAAVSNEDFHETRQAGAGRTTTGSGI